MVIIYYTRMLRRANKHKRNPEDCSNLLDLNLNIFKPMKHGNVTGESSRCEEAAMRIEVTKIRQGFAFKHHTVSIYP